MALEPITSYQELGKPYIPEQYKNSTNLLGLIAAVLEQCDELDQGLLEIYQALDVDTAIGPALDYIGALVGVYRTPGQTDDAYRLRIYTGNGSKNLPTFEGIRWLLLTYSKCSAVGLYPVYPAGLYAVFTGQPVAGFTIPVEELAPSGTDLGRGSFMCWEFGDDYLYIVDEDNGQPIVCDFLLDEYDLVDHEGDSLVDQDGNELIAMDYITTEV